MIHKTPRRMCRIEEMSLPRVVFSGLEIMSSLYTCSAAVAEPLDLGGHYELN